jgi:hypothetical protein
MGYFYSGNDIPSIGMSKLTTLLLGLWEWAKGWFQSSPDPLAPRDPGSPVASDDGDIEILGLYRHYSARDPGACIPYDGVDPNVYPDVWVVGRELRRDAHYLVGLAVDGYTVPLDDVQSVKSLEGSGDLRIAIIRYPRYARYRAAGPHEVSVLIGETTEDGRGVQWVRRIPYQIRTVLADD